MGFIQSLLTALKDNAEKVAIVDGNRQTTYAELYDEALRVAAYIRDRQIPEKSCVCISLPKSMEYFAAEIGCWLSGCTAVPMSDHYPKERVDYIMQHCEAKLCIGVKEFQEVSGSRFQEVSKGSKRFQEVSGDLLAIFYTSGSTGTPKGVMHTNESLAASVKRHAELCDIRPDDILGNSAPMYFIASMFDYTALMAGATVIIYPEEVRTDVELMSQYIKEHEITVCFMSPTMLTQYVTLTSHLRLVVTGSERLANVKPLIHTSCDFSGVHQAYGSRQAQDKPLIHTSCDFSGVHQAYGSRQAQDKLENFELRNAYGQTETGGVVSYFTVDKAYDNTPIGRAVDGVEISIMNEDGQPVTQGEEGEICLNGVFSPGYYKDSPFPCDMLHTGDLGKIVDGNLVYVNRKDWMVKISGQRVEPGEVETVMKRCHGVKDAIVKGFKSAQGNSYLCGFWIGGAKETEIESYLKQYLPEYMIPTCYSQVEAFPLNANGKVDRKSLTSPLVHPTNSGTHQEKDSLNVLETELRTMIATVLGTEDFSREDNLGYVGMTSITSIKLATAVYKKYGVELNAKTLAKSATLLTIEDEILKHWMHTGTQNHRDMETQEALLNSNNPNSRNSVPLSFTQQGVYTDCVANADSVQYNLPDILTFPSGITAEQLKDAVQKVFAAHPYMACHFFTNENGEVVQEPIQDFQLEIPVTRVTKEEFEAKKKDLVRPFDLNKGPLFRFEIYENENDNSLNLFVDIHHLISDGASSNLLYHEICSALDGGVIEQESYDYYQFVQDEKLDDTADAYFDQTIGGVEEVSRLLPDVYTDRQDHKQRSLSLPLQVTGLEEVCHKENITPAAFFLAAMAITVSRYLSEEDVTMVTISNGRSNLRISDTVGMFVNTLPLALHVAADDSTNVILQHAAQVFDAAIEHETYPFARVASKYGFSIQMSYACQLGVMDELTTKAGKVEMESLELDIAKAPVAVFINGTIDGSTGSPTMTLDIDYDSSLYTDTMIQHFAESMANVAEALTKVESLKDISLTKEKDWAQLDGFNLPFLTDYDHTDTVVSLFQKQVQKHPDKTAAIFQDKRYTYRELDEATDRLAAVIYDKVSKITGKDSLAETVVSIIIDRNEWVFLLPLAVLKTGCAYEPLDPSYPSERLNYMVQDAQARLLIGQPEFIPQVSEYKGEVLLTTELEGRECREGREGREGIEDIAPKPSDLLLMLYTSGSTGKPKGVQIEHHSLVSYAHGIAKADFYTEDCVAAAYASFGFDVCMSDTFCTLLNGGTLVVIPESLRLELKQLADYLESEHVTQIFMTTQVGVQFLQNYPDVKYLRYLGMGGEKLPAVSPEGLSYKILNGYGPTENTCGVSLYPIQHWEPNIPLGKPFPTIKGYVLDKAGHRLPPGACGEYCVAGDQPARGYLGLPEKTAEVFEELKMENGKLKIPETQKPLRMYHTGDVVRYRENGDVEFVGRKDGMVKIRGFRIELKEVEAAIRPFEGVKDVTVQAYDYDGGGKYLAAFVVADGQLDTSALLDFVKSQKPPYMVPAIVMQIDRIPLTVNQKVDKKALPKPQLAAAAYVAPKNKIEQDFCEIYAEVLGQEAFADGQNAVSAASDFFEIGGSSIIALKVVVAAEKRGYTIVYNDVFTYTTAQDMATYLGGETQEHSNLETQENQDSNIPGLQYSGDSFYGANTIEVGPDGFDYKEINALLRGNTLEAFQKGEQQPVGDVLLAGATGYLGIHVLKELIDNPSTGKIYCFIRGKGTVTAEQRLKNLLFYYFEHSYAELFGKRLFIVEGDVTEPLTFNHEPLTVINCAACVKHFSKGNEIERINVESVRNLIEWCVKTGSRLVHVSTGSVAGASVNNVPPKGYLFDEHVLYVGQLVDNNQYISSKFKAERLIYDAILHHGLNAKVIRVGNLAPRDKDGEFQINFKTNNFMATLAAFKALGMIPYAEMDSHVEFSPIDKVAQAILLLATTPKECVCFMASNQHRPQMGDIVMQLGEVLNDTTIRMVEMDEFQRAIRDALSDPAKVDKMRPFMAYAGGQTSDNIRQIGYDDISVSYTAQVLYRLGFSWPTTTEEYVRKFLRTINGFNFFD